MAVEYIIVQAGGKGSRMQALTRNKPKALVPINNLPMIFHLFRKYPNKKFVIIGDYKYDVLSGYLRAFADVEYSMVRGSGHTGTCAGLSAALEMVPEKTPFLLIWCDLVLPQEHELPCDYNDYIGISKDFSCRWKYENDCFEEEKSDTQGVAGYFVFQDKKVIEDVPQDGEFVRWLKEKKKRFLEWPLYHTHEYGLYSAWEKLPKMKCRPFNSIEVKDGKVIKKPIDAQGERLAVLEKNWYKSIAEKNGGEKGVCLPRIYEYDPLTMEFVDGKNVYEYSSIPFDQKKLILDKLIEGIRSIHTLSNMETDRSSFYEAYIGKTKKRLEKIQDLVPFANNEYITINGKKCCNIFYRWEQVQNEIMKFVPKLFCIIHGDCTFSNILLDSKNNPVMIDPRGYFGTTELYGDPAYDWVKLYYSLFSNYDQFNLKRFSLDILDHEVFLEIKSNHWEDMEDYFFEALNGEVTRKQMKLLLAIIWLSLTTYAWEDYDSICGAFYQGLIYLEEALRMSDPGMADQYFGNTIRILTNALQGMDMNRFEDLIEKAEKTLKRGHKIVASGLGKNVPVCEKFVGSLLSLGLDANFLHTNTAVHGDLGMIRDGDLVIVLSKSGNTSETVFLLEQLLKRDVTVSVITFQQNSQSERLVGTENCMIINLEHEGDLWNVMPNNSTTLYLIVLQGLAMTLAERLKLDLNRDFAPNHPGGAIGKELENAPRT